MPVFTDSINNTSNSGDTKQLSTIHLRSMNQGKHDLIRINGTICDKFATILIDGASTHNFISSNFIDRHQLHDQLLYDKGVIELGDGSTHPSSKYGNFPYAIQTFNDKAIFYVSQLST